jgi:rhodanese-related sulfurtransferase
MTPNPTFLEDVKSKLGPGSPAIVGCKSGRRSAAAAAALAGYCSEILDVDGGFDAWLSAGLPVET